MAEKNQPTGDYEVGYAKPPKAHQFRKGKSGNPNGRPKTRESGSTDVCGLLNEPVKVQAGGRERDMSPFEIAFRQLANRALKKDLRAILKFVKHCEEYGVIAPPEADPGGGVIHAPKGFSPQEWLESVAELVPVDEE